MSSRELYIIELAQTVNQMFLDEKVDLSAEEIAVAYFPGRALGGEIIEGIRKRLHKVRNILEGDYELPVYLLSATYYTRFRVDPPTTDADARRCLPTGNAKKAQGIALQQGERDIMWQARIEQYLAAGAGMVKKSLDRTLDSVDRGRLSEPRAAEMITDSQRKATPEKPELAERLVRELPAVEVDAE